MALSSVIRNIPVRWAEDATFYFENEFDEPWIATVKDGKIFISGCNIGWREISITYEEAIQIRLLANTNRFNVIKETIFDYSEYLWILSVIQSSFFTLQYSSENTA